MKYYQEIDKYGHSYDIDKYPPFNKPIYGFAYDINNETKNRRLICKPVLGEINDSYHQFVPYKKNSREFKVSGSVHMHSRWYADTLKEAIEMYNELVQRRIDMLQEMIEEAKGDMI